MFLNVCKQTFHISHVRISQTKRCFNAKFSTYHFHMKVKILADFQICIGVPLNSQILKIKVGWKYYTSYIIHNVIFRPHWLKPFSNWWKYNAKLSLNTKRSVFMFLNKGFHAFVLTKFVLTYRRYIDDTHARFESKEVSKRISKDIK